MLFFSLDGEFLLEIKSQSLLLTGYTQINSFQDIFTIKYALRESAVKLIKLSPPYQEVVEMTELSRTTSRTVPSIRIRYCLLPEDKLIWGVQSEYELYVFNNNGEMIRKIKKDHRAARLTQDYKDRYLERLPPGISKKSQNFRQSFPAYDQFCSDDEGRIFVKTFEKLESTAKYIIDVFDPDGRFICQTALKVGDEISADQDKFIIRNNMLYSGEIDKDEFLVLKRYRIIWNY